MTDPYANIRKALAKGPTQGPWWATLRELLAERDGLAAENARLREDAERLDWLASEAPPLWVSRDRGGYELPYFDITSGRECCDPGDLRAAIDRARRKGWRMRDLIGKPVRIEWLRQEDDWPTFTVLAYDPPMLHLQGRDDGRWKHDGGSFWVNVSEIASIVPEPPEAE